MRRYLLTRALASLVTFWLIITLVFFLARLAPGGPFDGERRLPPEVEANLLAAYNLDQPLPRQYLDYLAMLASGDLGPSFKQKDFTVGELISTGLPVSLAEEPLASVALGIGHMLTDFELLRKVCID